MLRRVALATACAGLGGCGVPVDIGLLDGGGTSLASAEVTTIDETVGPGPTSQGMTESSSESGEPLPPLRHDFALRFADLPDVGSDTTGNTGGGSSASTSAGETGSGETDPDALVIRATTGLATCEDPFGLLPCPLAWTYGFNLPPELQFVGAAGQLEDLNGFMAETGEGAVDCSFGGGTLIGRFEITAFDPTHVAGRMFDLEGTGFGTDVPFDAVRCSD